MNFKRFKKNLPDAYQELAYIQSGLIHLQTGYIDTGLVGTDLYGCEIETCMKVTAITGANLYYLNGAYVSGQTTQIGLIREDTEYVHSVANIGFNAVSYSGSIALSDWHTIYTSDGIQKTDGIIVSNETYGTLNNLRYLLFARSDTGVTLSPPFAMKYFWIKKNGQYIRNMIPAKRKSDDAVGMYDIANDVFYTSKSPYAFIGGTVVEPTWHDTPHYIHKTSTDTFTTLPAVLYPNDTTATVGLKGNMEQNGTPTPDNPIQPQSTGERTGNLLDATMYGNPALSVAYLSMTVAIPIVTLTSPEGLYTRVVWTKSTGAPERVHVSNWIAPENSSTFELALYSDADCFKIEFRNVAYSALTDEDIARRFNIMLNSGSTALPYEPYGYKIPISSANTTTPVYLGEVETTRKIRKRVLMGGESWIKNDVSNPSNYLYYQTGYLANKTCVCSHLADMGTLSPSKVGIFNGNSVLYLNFGSAIMDAQPSGNTVAGLKEYLAAQYANGTPVTVWYVLAEPTTGIVNEPLQKIGDYADTVSGITIPTIAGGDSFDVLTTLKPSEVTVNYKGWHPVTDVHERENGAWD